VGVDGVRYALKAEPIVGRAIIAVYLYSLSRSARVAQITMTTKTSPMTAGKVLVIGAIGLLLYVAHSAFVPVALALLFALILSGPVEALHKWRVPRSVSAGLILMIAVAMVAGIVNFMWTPAQEWFAGAPRTMLTIKQKITPVAKFMSRVEELRKNAGAIGSAAGRAPAQAAPVAAAQESAPVMIFDATREAVVGMLTFLIVTLFLLAGGPPMLARMTAAFVDDLNSAHVLSIIEKVRGEVGRFYVTTTLINLGLGLATAGAMVAWGMPTPYLWGVLAAALNFIPYAGSATTLLVITLVAVVSFNSLGQVLGVAGTYVVLAGIEGQIVQPLLVGRRLEVNPLLIFLALWFGGLFWGIAGVILATPTLLALKVIAEHASGGKAMLEFLGPNDQKPERANRLKRFARSFE
jgi:predicted PurR-regulated permease PerM